MEQCPFQHFQQIFPCSVMRTANVNHICKQENDIVQPLISARFMHIFVAAQDYNSIKCGTMLKKGITSKSCTKVADVSYSQL